MGVLSNFIFALFVLVALLVANSLFFNVPLLGLWKPTNRPQDKWLFRFFNFILLLFFIALMTFIVKTVPVMKSFSRFSASSSSRFTELKLSELQHAKNVSVETPQVIIRDVQRIDQYKRCMIKQDHRPLNHPQMIWEVELLFRSAQNEHYYFSLTKTNFGVDLLFTGEKELSNSFGNMSFYCDSVVAILVEKDLGIRYLQH